MIIIYGIKNCDTVKKALSWLDQHHITYRFHDFRKDGLNEQTLCGWVNEFGWEALLNRRGTAWRGLPEETKETLNETGAVVLMMTQPSLIKRPVLDLGKARHLGFNPETYTQLFKVTDQK